MLAYGIAASEVLWTPNRILVLTLMIMGGAGVFAALFLLYAALCFLYPGGIGIHERIHLWRGANMAAYPLDVYGREILKFCTYLIP